MNKLVMSVAAIALSASNAFAGTLTEPVVEEMVEMEEESGSSSGGILIPLLILAAVAALVASGGDDDQDTVDESAFDESMQVTR